MTDKFSILIDKIKSLSKEYDIDMNDQEVVLNHKMFFKETYNSYFIQLHIRRPRQMYIFTDTFIIKETDDFVDINYIRRTDALMPIFDSILPEIIERTFIFDKNEKQEIIYKGLMKNITDFFNEYNFIDTKYSIEGENN